MLAYDILKFETNLHQAMVTGNWYSICFFSCFLCGVYLIHFAEFIQQLMMPSVVFKNWLILKLLP